MIALLAAAALGAAAQPAPLEVLSTGLDLKVLTVAYETGPCWQDEREIGLAEDARAIRLTVVRERVEGCLEPPSYRTFSVLLRRPVGGRRIEGY